MQWQRMMTEHDLYLMEICGTHTMAIARHGIRSCLPPQIHLISGPGCPVCVTPASAIDSAIALAARKDVIVCSYGDMLRVPGSDRQTLAQQKALGRDVRLCLSVMDALGIARQHPNKEIIFLAVGFETSAPGTAVAIKEARASGLHNFTIYCLLKRTREVIETLLQDPDCRIDGFLCPGHVAAIIGTEGFRFLEKYQKSGVICGFESTDILYAIRLLAQAAADGKVLLENSYARVVRPMGNRRALALIDEVFSPVDSSWRGFGNIAHSGWQLREEYQEWDAEKRFGLAPIRDVPMYGCLCGEIIAGKKQPHQCLLFRRSCTPQSPYGPCMVSQEGTCAAAYQYE